jgi:thiamine biosynthesis lipoprotein
MPIVNAWGFGPKKTGTPTQHVIDSLKAFTGFDKVRYSLSQVEKSNPGVQLDFGGIGQGYGVDVVGAFMRSKGIKNMLIEIGGEGLAVGKNLQTNALWRVGILDPNSTIDAQFFKAYVSLENKSFTTSGNYFNYKVIDGRKYGHTIDPASGYPVQHSLLSASVFATDCTTADAWATAFMVMGIERSKEILESLPELEVIFIYAGEGTSLETYVSPSLIPFTLMEE